LAPDHELVMVGGWKNRRIHTSPKFKQPLAAAPRISNKRAHRKEDDCLCPRLSWIVSFRLNSCVARIFVEIDGPLFLMKINANNAKIATKTVFEIQMHENILEYWNIFLLWA
jgi:hypothetical protein